MLKDNSQLSRPGRNSGSTDAETKVHIEKQGYKRAEAAIYLGVAKMREHSRGCQRYPKLNGKGGALLDA